MCSLFNALTDQFLLYCTTFSLLYNVHIHLYNLFSLIHIPFLVIFLCSKIFGSFQKQTFYLVCLYCRNCMHAQQLLNCTTDSLSCCSRIRARKVCSLLGNHLLWVIRLFRIVYRIKEYFIQTKEHGNTKTPEIVSRSAYFFVGVVILSQKKDHSLAHLASSTIRTLRLNKLCRIDIECALYLHIFYFPGTYYLPVRVK